MGSIQARIDHGANSLVLERPSGNQSIDDRREMEHLQTAQLDKISQMLETNERCMDLLVNQNSYISQKDKEKPK